MKTAIVIFALSVGFMLGVVTNIGFASHLQKVSVITVAQAAKPNPAKPNPAKPNPAKPNPAKPNPAFAQN